MRSLLLVLFAISSLRSLQAQILVDSLPLFVVQKGIYTSYTSLRNNLPNRFDSFRIISRTKGDIFLRGGGPFEFELDSADKSEFHILRKALVGISNGKQFYISDKYTSRGMGISKCYLQGPYILSFGGLNIDQYIGGKLPRFALLSSGFVIDIRTREHVLLDEEFLKVFLKKYPELEEKYRNSDLMKYAIEILEIVNKMEKIGS